MQYFNQLGDYIASNFTFMEKYMISDKFKVYNEEINFFVEIYKPQNELEELEIKNVG